MTDHDELQIHGLAMLMLAKGRIFLGPDNNLYRVVPSVMPESVESDPTWRERKQGKLDIEVMMTWRPMFNIENKVYRIAAHEMELWADGGDTPYSGELTHDIVDRHAMEWFLTYGADLEMPERLWKRLGDEGF